MSATFEVTPQKLIFGGTALGYHDGRPVLVPRALPGERLEAEEVRTAKGMIHARILQVLHSAPERIEPACPWFADCGGCQYQHFSADRQAAWKILILKETLRRTGKIVWEPEMPAHVAFPWNYRNQAQIKVERGAGGKLLLGFFAGESHRLVDVRFCPILSPGLNRTLAGLRACLKSPYLAGCTEIEMMTDDRDRHVMLYFYWQLEPGKAERVGHEILKELPQVQTVAFESTGGTKILGQPALFYEVGDFRYQISPGSFFQASRFLLPKLASAIAEAAADSSQELLKSSSEERNASLVLDLYSGVGLLTLPLARHFGQVIGVEAHPGAARDLNANIRAHGLHNAKAVNQPVFDFLRRFAGPQPDLVVVDPPRAGVGLPSLRLLAKLRSRRIFYVSCNPPALARDLAFLLQQGYQLDSIEMFDFFPQTFHIEAFARLHHAACYRASISRETA